MSSGKLKVVIVGAGFGGIALAKSLGGSKNFSVTLIDRRNYHLFQPLLYQVAMAGLSAPDIAVPIRGLFSRYSNIETMMDEVVEVDGKNKTIKLSQGGTLEYDRLVLACGAKHSYFGKEKWEELGPGLKTLEQAVEIRRRVLDAFEKAETTNDLQLKKKYLTFIVVGGGPTGVELAGALGEISRYTLSRDFRSIDPSRARVILVEAGPRVLASFHPDLSRKAVRALESLGVQVWSDSLVSEIDSHGVKVGDEFIESSTVLWAARVKASSLNQQLNEDIDPQGRVLVNPDLSLKSDSNIFVIGDQAHFKGEKGALPGVAPVANQQGRFLAKVLQADYQGKVRPEFVYFDKGQMATIGRKMAVLEFGPIRLSGFVAWLAWLFVHIYFLIGFKNRLFVFLQWLWHYFTYSRGARILMNRNWRSYN